MRWIGVALLGCVTMIGCANGTGSSPSVPKKAIERAADTKITDAGSDASNADPSAAAPQ